MIDDEFLPKLHHVLLEVSPRSLVFSPTWFPIARSLRPAFSQDWPQFIRQKGINGLAGAQVFGYVHNDDGVYFAMIEWAIFCEKLTQSRGEHTERSGELQCAKLTSTANIENEKTSILRVNGKRSSSVRKTSRACHRTGPTTLVVVKVVVLNTVTNAKSTRRALFPSSTKTLL